MNRTWTYTRPWTGRYILEGKVPVPCEDLETWAVWLEKDPRKRVVKQEYVGNLWVSTVFIALDHNFLEIGPPMLFETLVFREATEEDRKEYERVAEKMHLKAPGRCPERITVNGFGQRYSTWEMALEGHREAVKWAKEQLH